MRAQPSGHTTPAQPSGTGQWAQPSGHSPGPVRILCTAIKKTIESLHRQHAVGSQHPRRVKPARRRSQVWDARFHILPEHLRDVGKQLPALLVQFDDLLGSIGGFVGGDDVECPDTGDVFP
jgi:hypothetical protein